MRTKIIAVVIAIVIVFTMVIGCSSFTAIGPIVTATPKATPTILEGTWKYWCFMPFSNQHNWYSTLRFEHAEMNVALHFDDGDVVWGEERELAFSIYPTLPELEHKYDDWLWVKTDGEIWPDFNHFPKNRFMKMYPGGYSAFEAELERMNIDWASMYIKLRQEFLMKYITQTNECTP